MVYIVMAWTIQARLHDLSLYVMAYVAMVYVVLAWTIQARLYDLSLYRYGLCIYGLCSYGLEYTGKVT